MINLRGGRVFLELLDFRNAARQALSNRESFFGQLDRGLQNFSESLRSPAIKHRVPEVDGSRNRTRKQTVVNGKLAAVVVAVPLDRGQPGGRSAAVDRQHPAGLGVVYQNERIPADPVAGGVGHAQNGLTGDRRVEGVSPGAQNVLGYLGGLRGTRRDSVASPPDYRPQGIAFGRFSRRHKTNSPSGENYARDCMSDSSNVH